MFRLLKPGGHLILTFPYNEKQYIYNAYSLPDTTYEYPKYICQIFSQREIDIWMQENNGKIVEQEYYEVYTGELWGLGERIHPSRKVSKQDKYHLTCILIQKI